MKRKIHRSHRDTIKSITSFKDRTVNTEEPVEVYRCLNRKGKVFSLRQNGKVVGHSKDLLLRDVEFKVSEAGRDRCRTIQERNVHAYIKGMLIDTYIELIRQLPNKHPQYRNMVRVRYNPYTNDSFVSTGGRIINTAERVVVTGGEVFANGINKTEE